VGKDLIARKNGDKFKVETSDGIRQASLIDLDVAVAFWVLCDNIESRALLAACAMEALERRLDRAFNVQRTEEERNQRLAIRIKGKIERRNLTDAIRDYIDNTDVSDNYRKFVYSNCSDIVNKFVLGCSAKTARTVLNLNDTVLLRDHLPPSALRQITRIEELTQILVD
jgi:hypothetical protein